jgi:importin subunit beta-1
MQLNHSLTHFVCVCDAAASAAVPAAEQQLNQWRDANLADLAHALAVEIGAPGRQTEVRQVAAVYLKNLLAGKSLQSVLELRQRWLQHVDPASRHRVKQALLASMTSAEPKAASSAALAAAEIAAAELPYEQWNEFVPALMEIVTGAAAGPAVRLAALECLGYAAERLAELEMLLPDVPPLSDAVVDKMLTSIVHGMQPTQDPQIRLNAITALRNALGFVRKNMSVKSERDFMVRAICESTQCAASDKVRELAYGCMDLLAELYYDVLGDYMTVFFQLTTNAIRGGPAPGGPANNVGGEFVETKDEVKIAAIEFWSTIAYTELGLLEEERDRADAGLPPEGPPCPRYTVSVLETLVPLLLEALTKQGDDVEVDEWNLQAAGAVCLESLSGTVESLIVPAVIPFVQANISNAEWRLRDAAIVAFASIMEGPETAVIGPYVAEAIPLLLQRFQDPVPVVRDSSVHCVSKICRVHIGAVTPDLLQHVIQGLIGKLQEPSPSIAAHASSAIYNIAVSIKSPDGSVPGTNVLSAPMLPLLQALLVAADRDDPESNLRVSAMSAAAELVSAAAMDSIPIFRDFLPAVVGRTEAALQLQVVNKEDTENKEILLGLLCALVTVLFQRLDAPDVHPHVDRCMTVLLQTLNQRLAVEEALLSIGAVAGTMEAAFVVRRLRILRPDRCTRVTWTLLIPRTLLFYHVRRSTCPPSCPS